MNRGFLKMVGNYFNLIGKFMIPVDIKSKETIKHESRKKGEYDTRYHGKSHSKTLDEITNTRRYDNCTLQSEYCNGKTKTEYIR